MTTIESIQSNIHYYKTMLIRLRNIVPNDPLEEINKNEGIEYYINTLSELKESLKNAINQTL